MTSPANSNRLLQSLPAIFQVQALFKKDRFDIGWFLTAFEKILLGDGSETGFDGLEETIAGLALIFDPEETPDKFLSWLSGWTAFTLRADLDLNKQKNFLANIIPSYRRRGTLKNLENLLTIFTIGKPVIMETDQNGFQIGVHSTIGEDTYLGGGAPHFFKVTISLARDTPEALNKQIEITSALIELEKPAHTTYSLEVNYPSMQIGVYSTIGVDTLLGTEDDQQN